MDAIAQDLRYALRQLVRSPAFTAIAVATLALGIGANTALFSLVDAILLRPLPGITNAERLVWVSPTHRGGSPAQMSFLDYQDYRTAPGLADLAAFSDLQLALGTGGEPVRLRSQIVTGNYFRLLGAPFALGRGFTPGEDSAGAQSAVAVIGYDLWQRRFAADPAIIGRTITLNGGAFTVVGVAARYFNGADLDLRRDVWVPMSTVTRASPELNKPLERRNAWFLTAIGRLKPGVSRDQADAAVNTIAQRIAKEDSVGHAFMSARTYRAEYGLPPAAESNVLPVIALAGAATAIILLIACANVSNLLLGRGVARRRELSVRLSLGAGRGRLVRQLLTESLILAALASAGGLLLAAWTADLVLSRIDLPFPIDTTPNGRVLGFSLAAAVLTTIVFGLIPALDATRGDLAGALRSVAQGDDRRRSRMQGALVIAQLSLAVVLLSTGGLFLRSLYKATRVDVGFDATTSVLAASFDLGTQGYDDARVDRFLDALSERAQGLPGVERVSITSQVPLADRHIATSVRIASSKPAAEAAFDPRTAGSMFLSVVRPAYFASIGIDLVGGRDFNGGDARGGLPVAIVSESFAKRSWPNESAIGQRIALGGETAPYLTIIGVARDAVMSDVSQRGETVVYVPQRQHAGIKSLTLIVRSTGDAGQLASALRREIRALDPALPVYGVETLAQFRDASLAKVRNASGALALCGALALTLAAIGIYGVMSFAVGRRRREIGIRVALGALHVEVVALFLRQGLKLTAAGLAIGLGLSLVMTRLLSAMLLGVTPTDMLTFVAVAALLGIVAQLAVWIPARRAARVDPMEALRQE